ncbi:hypothetical protein DFH08DRAFT_908559 [Mycena albidolilacea]|uniref:Uncharacterized protein n=1 Tax=Mycena albidolilacea TaxID=1033008 RepID=A0AAD6YWA4_9AGAR|nr:hypothetical protein DFH08DRAFT_908559 [Mycena albidolilacea]
MSICGRMPRHYAPTRRQPLPTERSMRRVSIHSLHHTTASSRPILLSACTDRIRRTSARARKPSPTILPTAPAAPHPLILRSRLLLAEKRRGGNHPRTHARFALAVHDAGQRGAGAAKPSFTTRPLFVLPTICVTADSFLRWDSGSTCILSSRDAPMKTSRTVWIWSRVCVSAGTRSIALIGGAGRGREREKLPMGSMRGV